MEYNNEDKVGEVANIPVSEESNGNNHREEATTVRAIINLRVDDARKV